MPRGAMHQKPETQAAKARLSRPGKAKPTDAEKRARRRAYALGVGLNERVLKLIARNVRNHERVIERIDAGKEVTRDERESLMTNFDLLGVAKDLQDRFGQPKRSQVDLDVDAAGQQILVLPPGLWEGKADAAGAPARG